MCLGDAIFGEMDIDNATSLEHELPNKTVAYALVEVADIDGGFFVLFPEKCELMREDLVSVRKRR